MKTKLTPEEIAYYKAHTPAMPAPPPLHVPTCPTCSSVAVKRITGGAKVGRVLLIGVFAAPKAMKSYECLTCKARW